MRNIIQLRWIFGPDWLLKSDATWKSTFQQTNLPIESRILARKNCSNAIVDGRNPANHLGCKNTLQIMGWKTWEKKTKHTASEDSISLFSPPAVKGKEQQKMSSLEIGRSENLKIPLQSYKTQPVPTCPTHVDCPQHYHMPYVPSKMYPFNYLPHARTIMT